MDCCWAMMRGNFVEANAEISTLIERLKYLETGELPDGGEYGKWLERKWRDTTEFGLFISMEHAYHHLNFGWNCRHFPEKRVIACAERDYRVWEKFPADWPELWPSPSRCKGTPREVYRGKVHYLTMRMPLDEVEMTLDDIIEDIDATFPDTVPIGMPVRKVRSGRPPMTEELLAEQMRHIYNYMNDSWNSRKMTMERYTTEVSKAAMLRHRQYPRAFVRFWPKKKVCQK